MKKFIYILSAALLLAGVASVFTSCEKGHAYSYSPYNKFKVAGSSGVINDALTINAGMDTYIIAVQTNKDNAYLGGEYSASSEDPTIVKGESGKHDLKDCIVLRGLKPGETSVTLNLWHDGFHLYKTVKVKVQ